MNNIENEVVVDAIANILEAINFLDEKISNPTFYLDQFMNPRKVRMLTLAEKTILENIDGFEWICRDVDGGLLISKSKPCKGSLGWIGCSIMDVDYLNCFNKLFGFIRWEDDEPYHIGTLLLNAVTYNAVIDNK